MNGELHELDVVALLDELPAKHFETGAALLLRRGQLGTVVMIHDDGVCEVEFSDPGGRAYAMLPIALEKLMLLHSAPVPAPA